MQPRNAFQRKVVALSTGVKPVSSTQFSWANINCFDKKGTFTSKRANCFECGDTWRIDGSGMSQKTCKCPSCGVRLKMERSRSMKHGSAAYFAIVTTVSDVQLIRMFLITKKCMVGHVAAFEYSEVMQHWIGENGARAVFSKLVNGFNYACDAWLHASALELRGTLGYSQTMRNGIVPYKIYPKMQVIPAIRRNGFEGKFHGVAPLILFTSILIDSKAETLLKTGQVHLLRVYPDHRNWIDNLWGSIKICIRRKYIIPDALIWKDYLQLLDNYSCDLRNARFVCPENLQEAHDQLVQKKLADDKKKLALAGQDAERVYRKARSMFFGLCFSDGDITINVIGS